MTNTMIDDIELPDDATRPVAPQIDNLTDAQRLPGQHLRMIHDHLRQNMQVVRKALESAESGEISATEVRDLAQSMPLLENYRRFGALCGQYCQIIHTHHSIEDAYMLPDLSAKAAAFKKVTDRLMDEHKVVHELLLRLIDALNASIPDPDPEAFAQARHVYAALERLLSSHFRYEEDSVGDALGYFGIGI